VAIQSEDLRRRCRQFRTIRRRQKPRSKMETEAFFRNKVAVEESELLHGLECDVEPSSVEAGVLLRTLDMNTETSFQRFIIPRAWRASRRIRSGIGVGTCRRRMEVTLFCSESWCEWRYDSRLSR